MSKKKAWEALRPEQRLELARRALRWIFSIERLNQTGDRFYKDPFSKYGETQDDLHLLMIALEHVSQCVQMLREPPCDQSLDELAGAFLAEWLRIDDVRDSLEHEEEYIAGRGKFPDRPAADWADRGYQRGTFVWDNDGIVAIAVLGRSCGVENAIKASLALKEPLAAVAEGSLE